MSNMSNTFSRPGYQPAVNTGGNLRRRLLICMRQNVSFLLLFSVLRQNSLLICLMHALVTQQAHWDHIQGNNRQLKLKVSHTFKTLKTNHYLDFKTFLNMDFAPQDGQDRQHEKQGERGSEGTQNRGKEKVRLVKGERGKTGYDGGWEEVC